MKVRAKERKKYHRLEGIWVRLPALEVEVVCDLPVNYGSVEVAMPELEAEALSGPEAGSLVKLAARIEWLDKDEYVRVEGR